MAHRKQTPAQRAASLRNLRKARKARKAHVSHAGRKHTHSSREASRRHAIRHAPRRRHRRSYSYMARDSYPGGWTDADIARYYGAPRRRRKSTSTRKSPSHPRRAHRTAKQRAAAIRNLAKARAHVTTAGRRRGQLNRRPHMVRGYYAYRNGRRYRVPAHYSREEARRHRHSGGRRRGAMENPLGVSELLVGGLTGVIGFGVADVLDRYLATHALTDSNNKDSNQFEIYNDNPPSTGSYPGLYNATAILAPIWKSPARLATGLGVAAVPLIGAHFIKSPTGRAALQFFGFGAGIRVVGKALVDATSMMLKKTSSGQRLYDGELRAQVALAGGQLKAPTYPTLPVGFNGVPQAHGFGCGCRRCGGAPAITPAAVSTPTPPAAVQQPTGTVVNPTPPTVAVASPAPAAVATNPAPTAAAANPAPAAATGTGARPVFMPPRMPQRLRSA